MGNLTIWDGIIIAAICAFDEWIIKKLICKGDKKFVLLYTLAPFVLSIITYIVIALINHNPWSSELVKGISVGALAMASYDTIIAIIKQKGITGVADIGQAVVDEISTKKIEEK